MVFNMTLQAQTLCPSVDAVKASNARQWLALNINDDEPVSPEELKQFLATVHHFAGAGWSQDYEYGYGRCYYDSESEVYVASYNNPVPTRPTLRPWLWDGVVANCRSGSIAECAFP